MPEEDVASLEYLMTRALKNFDTVVGDETQAMIRLALRQGRNITRAGNPSVQLESLSKFAEAMIESRKRVYGAWQQINEVTLKLQKMYGNTVKQLDIITTANCKFENFLGRSSGISDLLEGILQEADDQERAQKIIERLVALREEENKAKQASPVPGGQ